MLARVFKGIHWPVVSLGLILTAFGLFFIYSASFRLSQGFVEKQAVWALISIIVLIVSVGIGYRSFLNMSYVLYGITLLLLVYVLLAGETHLGASRWMSIGPFALQPSELCKFSTMLALAHFLSERLVYTEQKRTLMYAMLMVGVPVLLILKQPDLGSSLVFIPVMLAMLFLWGVRIRYLVALSLSGLMMIPILWQFLKPYQQKRILVFFDPSIDPIGASYTAIQSKIAVGSGGLVGKGWLGGTQTQLDFVPEHHTDFIFSVIGEEFGFLGSAVLLTLFGMLIYFIFDIFKHTTDVRAKLLTVGIATFLFFQVFVNIGMTIGLAPITGLTLPFMSYGGSSLVTTFFSLGMLVSIYKERSIF